jgi:hypothetical protein
MFAPRVSPHPQLPLLTRELQAIANVIRRLSSFPLFENIRQMASRFCTLQKMNITVAGLMLLLAISGKAFAGAGPPPPPPAAPPGPDASRCSTSTPQFCLNAPSGGATDLDALRVMMTTPRGCAGGVGAGQLGSNCGSAGGATGTARLRAPIQVAATSGAAALLDAESSPWAVWANYGRARSKGTVSLAQYTADLDSYRIGADRSFGSRYVFGAAFSGESGDTSTPFNGGSQDREAYMLSPYVLIVLNDMFTIDVNAGVGTNRVSQRRIDPTSGGTLSSSYRGTRWFTSATLNGSKTYGDIVFGARAGVFEAQEMQRGYTETGGPNALGVGERTPRLGQVLAGADIGYTFFGRMEAYASGVLRYDVHRNNGGNFTSVNASSVQSSDRSGFDWTLGLRLFSRRHFSGFVEYTKTIGREGFDLRMLNLLGRLEL